MEFLSIWLDAPPLADHTQLWGHPVYWWRRVAKLVQYSAGALVLAEIIGEGALSRLAQRLRRLHGRIEAHQNSMMIKHARRMELHSKLEQHQPTPKYIFEYHYDRAIPPERHPNPEYNAGEEARKRLKREPLEQQLATLGDDRVSLLMSILGFVVGVAIALTLSYRLMERFEWFGEFGFFAALALGLGVLTGGALAAMIADVYGTILVRYAAIATSAAVSVVLRSLIAVLRSRRTVLAIGFLMLTVGTLLDLRLS